MQPSLVSNTNHWREEPQTPSQQTKKKIKTNATAKECVKTVLLKLR